VRWEPKEFLPWGVRVAGKGVLAYSQSRDGSLDVTVFCRSDKIPRLQITGLGDVTTLRDKIPDAHFSFYGNEIDNRDISVGTVNQKPTIELKLSKIDMRSIKATKPILRIDSSNAKEDWFEYHNLSREGAVANISFALRNCT
jgi:hypothetical protein